MSSVFDSSHLRGLNLVVVKIKTKYMLRIGIYSLTAIKHSISSPVSLLVVIRYSDDYISLLCHFFSLTAFQARQALYFCFIFTLYAFLLPHEGVSKRTSSFSHEEIHDGEDYANQCHYILCHSKAN